jgi:hypothetical protein
MAKDAQTIKPTELDVVKAFMLHAQAQRQADADYAINQKRQSSSNLNMSVQRTPQK